MIRLSREIRFALLADYRQKISNSWNGWPSTTMVVPHLVLNCVVEGKIDKQTGYICNIKTLDDLLRAVITEKIIPHFKQSQTADGLLRQIYKHSQNSWTSDVKIVQQTLSLTPFLQFTIRSENEQMIEMTQQFEFSAAHRLHCDQLSDGENKKIFGKCNNLEGHGHNYVVEVSVQGEPDGASGQIIELHEFESTVNRQVIDRLDHKHLNRDIDYFANENPSVENIAVAIWNWLEGKFGDARLSNVRVYETPKTWAEFSK